MIIICNELEKTIVLKSTDKEKKKGLDVNEVYSEVNGFNNHDEFYQFLDNFLASDKGQYLKKGEENSLIIPDSFVGFSYFNLPPFSKIRLKDVFEIKFRSSYPNFADLYMNYFEYSRSKTGTVYFYSIARKESIKKIQDLFGQHNIKLSAINYFSKYIANYLTRDRNKYPHAVLIIGKANSEIIIHNGRSPVCASVLDYGLDVITNQYKFLDSPYNGDNKISHRYANFVKENFASKTAVVSDENIMKFDADPALFSQKPRELRVLKDELLENYTVKNNMRKFYSRVADVFDYYSHEPFFHPIKEVIVFCDKDFFPEFVGSINEFSEYSFNFFSDDICSCFVTPTKTSTLFKRGLAKERKKLDWKKFFSMDIGKKKKKD